MPLKDYPESLSHLDRLLGFIATLALILAGTLLIILIWTDSTDWIWQLVGNLGAVIVSCLGLIAVDQLLGRTGSLFIRVVHFIMAFSIIGCLTIATLVIWGATDGSVAFKAIGTILVLLLVACIGVPISKLASAPKS